MPTWIKCSEKMPDKVGEKYFVKLSSGNHLYKGLASTIYKDGKHKKILFIGFHSDSSHYIIDNVVEWLDESDPVEKDLEFSQPDTGWISVEELPEADKLILLFTQNKYGDDLHTGVTMGYYQTAPNEQWTDSHYETVYGVTHWRELPKKPNI